MIDSIQGMGQVNRMGAMPAPKPLSEDQQKQVSEILSKYDSKNVTTADAKAIFKAFEEAGIKGGGLRDAVQKAGFSADQVWSLAHDGKEPPRPGGESGSNKINAAAVQSLKSILDQMSMASFAGDDGSAAESGSDVDSLLTGSTSSSQSSLYSLLSGSSNASSSDLSALLSGLSTDTQTNLNSLLSGLSSASQAKLTSLLANLSNDDQSSLNSILSKSSAMQTGGLIDLAT